MDKTNYRCGEYATSRLHASDRGVRVDEVRDLLGSLGSLALACLALLVTGCVETQTLPATDGGHDGGMGKNVDAATDAAAATPEDAAPSPEDAARAFTDAGEPSEDDAGEDAGEDAGASPCPPCGTEAPICHEISERCVLCTDDAHCSDSTPVCALSAGPSGAPLCVACETDAHCPVDSPVCAPDGGPLDGSRCVGCIDDDDCGGIDRYCDPTSNRCRQCLGDSHCEDPAAARCDPTGVCTGCQNSGQCARFASLGVCDGGPGRCVQCTGAEDTACGSSTCRSDYRCSAFGSNQSLCETCDDDSNCTGSTSYCVGSREEAYCFQRSGLSSCPRHMSVISSDTSVSGVAGFSYCGISPRSTCEAILATIDGQSCTVDGDCGAGGLCRTVNGIANRCTYECARAADCAADNAYCPDGPMPCPSTLSCPRGQVFSGEIMGLPYFNWFPNHCGGSEL